MTYLSACMSLDFINDVRPAKAVSYNTVEDEEDQEGGGEQQGNRDVLSSPPSKGGGPRSFIAAGGGASMEAALLQKNRHLEHELTMARLRGVDTRAELDAAIGRLNELEGQVSGPRVKWIERHGY